jgi:hypothetical protein
MRKCSIAVLQYCKYRLFSKDKLIILISLKHDLEREFTMQGFLTKTQDGLCCVVALAPWRMPERGRLRPPRH